jgi:hypothetical protein
MFKAILRKEWGEVRRSGRGKVEDWSWEVAFYETPHFPALDRHCYKTEAEAKLVATLFESGDFHLGQYGEVVINKVFA